MNEVVSSKALLRTKLMEGKQYVNLAIDGQKVRLQLNTTSDITLITRKTRDNMGICGTISNILVKNEIELKSIFIYKHELLRKKTLTSENVQFEHVII